MKNIGGHIQHYLPLIGIIFASVVGFAIFSYDRLFQMMIVIGASFAYIAWGIVHHHIHHDLHLSVIVEYVTIAALGVTVIFLLLFRA
jgi:hypothetical protein